ncbi:DUF707 domain-containing protein [Bowmanella dokdonensis]|uniref:DUF707 domain-containing protein n=1 Tax=Bowmanella dokdonensis TaxID=751969 RepID=A0A939DRP1_9ALTE|nr:DUF707 domain-containing protein [Bowmanella dokdonensis]MBN7827514.1 DUF707 domain-containing protein [Bowmanella dokdonensis]
MSYPKKRSDYLIFSSIGDSSNISCWLGDRNFDLWLAYYGDDKSDKFSSDCEFYIRKKGAKFPNFYHLYGQLKDVVHQYKYIMIADDDLVISAGELNKFFDIIDEQQLSLAQPAFDLCGKVSHKVTKMHSLSKLRYTNFVEVTCPAFKTTYLKKFMNVYDEEIVGWGADWWFSSMVEELDGFRNTIAIVDQVTCLNPLDSTKKNGREIDRIQNTETRQQVWSKVKQHYGLNIEEVARQKQRILSFDPVLLLKYTKMRAGWIALRLLERINPR